MPDNGCVKSRMSLSPWVTVSVELKTTGAATIVRPVPTEENPLRIVQPPSNVSVFVAVPEIVVSKSPVTALLTVSDPIVIGTPKSIVRSPVGADKVAATPLPLGNGAGSECSNWHQRSRIGSPLVGMNVWAKMPELIRPTIARANAKCDFIG